MRLIRMQVDGKERQIVILEVYCSKIDCDCRRVNLTIMDYQSGAGLGQISYGWDSAGFYEKWMRSDGVEDLVGVSTKPITDSYRFGNNEFDHIKKIIYTSIFTDMCKRHYSIVRNGKNNSSLPKLDIRKKIDR
ncbi:MAG: hypothetical protein HRT88_06585 [Lentisphaeraceae bacterium]|nr:hypothetical protein [Lentisphaeraceae bacterium]